MNSQKRLWIDRVRIATGAKNGRQPGLHLLLGVVLLLFSFSVFAEMVNINKADAEALQMLNGVGPVKAAAIVDYRKKHGPFKNVDQLKEVPGIGDGILQKNKGNISLSRGLVRPAKTGIKRSSATGTKKAKRLDFGNKRVKRSATGKTLKKKPARGVLTKDMDKPKVKKTAKKKKVVNKLRGDKKKKKAKKGKKKKSSKE